MPGIRGPLVDIDMDNRNRRLEGGTDTVLENFKDDSPFNSETVYVQRSLDGGKGRGSGNFKKKDGGGSEGGEGGG